MTCRRALVACDSLPAALQEPEIVSLSSYSRKREANSLLSSRMIYYSNKEHESPPRTQRLLDRIGAILVSISTCNQ